MSQRSHDSSPHAFSRAAQGVSRRGFLAGASLAGLGRRRSAAAAARPAAPSQPPRPRPSLRQRGHLGDGKKLHFSNWPLYIDVKKVTQNGKKVTTPHARRLREADRHQVDYTEDINDNNEFFGKVQNQLAACQPTGRDIIVLTDWMAARMIRLGWVQKLDQAQDAQRRGQPARRLKSPSFDPNRDYSIPWQSGLAGIAYNAKVTEEVRTVDELLDPARPQGQGHRADRDARHHGHAAARRRTTPRTSPPTSSTRRSTAPEGRRRRPDPPFTGNDYAPDLAKGDIAACVAGPATSSSSRSSNPDIKFVAPEAGLMLWSRQHAGPEQGRPQGQRRGADQLLLRPGRWPPSSPPTSTTSARSRAPRTRWTKIDPSLADNPLIFPDEDDAGEGHGFMALDRGAGEDVRSRSSSRSSGLTADDRPGVGRRGPAADDRSPRGSASSPPSTTST